ncbi:unnamed protein product [Arctogadus glacialis]
MRCPVDGCSTAEEPELQRSDPPLFKERPGRRVGPFTKVQNEEASPKHLPYCVILEPDCTSVTCCNTCQQLPYLNYLDSIW